MQSRLERSTTNKVIAGVCGGLADYLQVDATIIRVVFVVTGLMTAGLSALGYIALLLVMPLPGRTAPIDLNAPSSASVDADAPAGEGARSPVTGDPRSAERRRAALGYFLIAIGIVFALGNVGLFRIVRWDVAWPLVLIGLGVLVLTQRIGR